MVESVQEPINEKVVTNVLCSKNKMAFNLYKDINTVPCSTRQDPTGLVQILYVILNVKNSNTEE